MDRSTKILLALNLMSRLQGATIAELMTALDISRRSVYRLLDRFKELYIPFETNMNGSGSGKILRVNPFYLAKLPQTLLPGLSFDFKETLSLGAALQKGSAFGGPQASTVTELLQRKFESELSYREPNSFNLPLTVIFLIKKPNYRTWKNGAGLVDLVAKSAFGKRKLSVTYDSYNLGETKKWKAWPLKLFEYRDGCYGFFFLEETASIRMLALERIRSAALLEERFTPPADDLQARLDSAFQITIEPPLEVSIHFAAKVAAFIAERTWSQGQNFSWQKDKSLVLTFTAGGLKDIARWVLSFGQDVEALEPLELRRLVQTELKAALSRYEKG